MNIIIRISNIEPRTDGSGQISVDAQAFTQEVDVEGNIIEQPIPSAHKSILVDSDSVIQALDGIDPATQRNEAEAALFELALRVAEQDSTFNVALISARLEANAKSSAIANSIKQIMGNGNIDVPVYVETV